MPREGHPSHTSSQTHRALPKLPTNIVAGFSRDSLATDVLAGVAVAAVVVPQSMAYAEIAGLPPQAGIFVMFAAPLVYALLGTSRQLICGPSSATAAISFAHISSMAHRSSPDFASLSAALAIVCGVIFLVLGVLRLGFVAQYISPSVQIGFLFGLGLTIMSGQAFTLLGLESRAGPFIDQVPALIEGAARANMWTLATGLAALVVMIGLGRFVPTFPAALLVVALSIVLSSLLNLPSHGVAVLGHMDRALPTPAIPLVPPGRWLDLLPGALAIVFISSSEGTTIARRFADMHQYTIKLDREFVAVGASAVASGLVHGFAVSGGTSQSAVNDRAGAKSQVSSLVLSAVALITGALLLPVIADMPTAVLAAIVVSVVRGFISFSSMREIWEINKQNFIIAVVAVVGVLVFGVLTGLVLAVGLSIFWLLFQYGRPRVTVLNESPERAQDALAATPPGTGGSTRLLELRPEAAVLFINADWIRAEVQTHMRPEEAPPEVLALDLAETPDLDYAGIKMIGALRDTAHSAGARVWLTNVHPDVDAALRHAGLLEDGEPQWTFASSHEARAALAEEGKSSDNKAV